MIIKRRVKKGALALLLAMAVAVLSPVGVLAADEADGSSAGGSIASETGSRDDTGDDLDREIFQQAQADAKAKTKADESAEEEVVEEEEILPVTTVTKSEGPLADLLDEAALNPTSPRSDALDAYLDELLPTIISDDMDTYAQVKACYDYLVQTMNYGSHTSRLSTPIGNTTCSRIYSAYGEVEGFGAVALTAKTGMCNAYASAFILMTRKLGLDANLVKGSTKGAGGGYVHHEWAEINVEGNVYIFDPQLEQNLRSAGLPAYSVFFKTYSQVGSRYAK